MNLPKNLQQYLKSRTLKTKTYGDDTLISRKIYVPSAADINALPLLARQAEFTDYAGGANSNGTYWLRDTSSQNGYENVSCTGGSGVKYLGQTQDFIAKHPYGVRPMFSVDLQYFDDADIKPKAVKDASGKTIFYTMNFGEMPQSKVPDATSLRLEQLYQSDGDFYDNYKRTNNVYSGFKYDEFWGVQMSEKNPEVFWRGEKFVRTINSQMQPVWFKVEPIECIITNWKDLPTHINPNGSGRANFAEVLTKNIVSNQSVDNECVTSFRPWRQSTTGLAYKSSFLNQTLNETELSFANSCLLPIKDENCTYSLNINDDNDTKDVMKYLDIDIKHLGDTDVLDIAAKFGKKYLAFNFNDKTWRLTNRELDPKQFFSKTVYNYKAYFDNVTSKQLTELNNEALQSYFDFAEKNPNCKIPFFFASQYKLSEKEYQNFQPFITNVYEKYILAPYNASNKSPHAYMQYKHKCFGALKMAQYLDCFNPEKTKDINGKTCTKAQRGLNILTQLLEQGCILTEERDLNQLKGKLEQTSIDFVEKNIKNFMNIEPYMHMRGGVSNQFWKMLIMRPAFPATRQIAKRVQKFNKEVVTPYMNNPRYLYELSQHLGYSPDETKSWICDFAFHIGYFHNALQDTENFCKAYNTFAERYPEIKQEPLLPQDFDFAQMHSKIEKNLDLILKNKQYAPLLCSYPCQLITYQDKVPEIYMPFPVFMASQHLDKLLKCCTPSSLCKILHSHFSDSTFYPKLIDQVAKFKPSGVLYPAQFLANAPTDAYWNDKEFRGNVYKPLQNIGFLNQNSGEEYEKLCDIAAMFGCFSGERLDATSSLKKTTYAQRASTILGKILQSKQISPSDFINLFNSIAAQDDLRRIEPCKEFLDFIGHQDKDKQFDNLAVLQDLAHIYGQNLTKALYDWKEVAQQRATDASGHANNLPWKDRIIQYIDRTPYFNIHKGYQDLASLALAQGAPQSVFEKAQYLFEKAEENNIPEHVLGQQIAESIDKLQEDIAQDLLECKDVVQDAHNKLFRYEMLNKRDPMNAFIGGQVHCCCTLTSSAWGSKIAQASIEQNNVQHLVLRDKSNQIVGKASMYFSDEQKCIVINEFDLRHENRKQANQAFNAFMRGIKAVVQAYDKKHPDAPLEYVVAGVGCTKLKEQTEQFERVTENFTVPAELGFADAEHEQRILYDRKQGFVKPKIISEKKEDKTL